MYPRRFKIQFKSIKTFHFPAKNKTKKYGYGTFPDQDFVRDFMSFVAKYVAFCFILICTGIFSLTLICIVVRKQISSHFG